MLKRILGAFFPGFSWEHGFALWDMGTAIGVGASLIGGMMGDDASEDAAKQIGKANALTQRQIKEQQAQNDERFDPYTRIGSAASNRLATLLGLDSGSNFGYGDLVEIDESGRFVPNDDLYRLSPEYRASWNAFITEHDAKYGKEASLQNKSFINGARDVVASRFNLDGFNTAQQEKARSDPEFGDLLRKFARSDLDSDVVYNTGLQFGLDEGNKAINRRAAASGGWDSGSTLKALARYANDYGSTKAEGAYNRFMNDKATTYNFLSGQQGVGLNATSNNQSLNTGLLTAGANANMGAAQQQGQLGMQGANIMNNSIVGGIGGLLYSNRAKGGDYGYSSGTPWYLG